MAPTPLPLEQMPGVGGGGGYLPAGQEGNRPGGNNTMSMSVLIDFIIQRTYHELTVLAELLPRKTDMERKVEIYDYAARTRHLFTRLNALVKWGNSVSKVDKSSQIMSFLDKQNMLFVETADMLARMSRETLVRARLPNFHIPAAVEVLTTGTYNRLPTCIRERIVPPDAITAAEKKQTLLRLNQVIQHRLVTGKLLPQMREFRIRNGRVTFEVKHEFSVALTVMGDSANVPWRLLDIDILVEDKETGDGKALVHPLQVNYIHQLIQARLVENPNALSEVYNCLHYFCQSLQLEVLYTQTLRLNYERLDENNITVEEYLPGVKLTVSYWRDLKSELGYRLTVQSDPSEIGRPLAVVHVPSLGAKESADVADRAVRSEHLSMERLIVHTVYIRSVSRLSDLKLEFQAFLKDVDFNLQGTPAILTVPVLSPCLRAEQIHITIDTHTGMFRCHVPKHLDCPITDEMQDSLNGDRSKLPSLLSELRYWITHRRCEKTLQHLPATATETLPFLALPDQELLQQGRHKIYVKLHRHPNIILVVQLKEKSHMPNEMEYTFHLGFVAYQKDDVDVIEDSAKQLVSVVTQSSSEIPKFYTKLMRLIEFDTFVATHGPGTEVDEISPHKRKSNGDVHAPPAKQQKTIFPAYFIPELAHVVAMCDEKIPFMNLAQTLTKHNIPHSGLQVEANATSLVLKILALPQPGKAATPAPGETNKPSPPLSGSAALPKIESHVWEDLQRRMLSISVRSQTNKNSQVRIWVVEFVFYSTPLQSSHQKEQGSRRTVYLTYEQANHDFSKTVEDLLNDWSKIVYLYALVYDFAEQLKNKRHSLADMLVVKSYSYMNLLVGYGPKKEVSCNIYWSVQSHGFRLTFVGGMSAVNAHSMMRDQLAQHLNQQHSLTQIANILHETYSPMSSIAKLPVLPILGIPRPNVPVLSFCMLPQSPCLMRLTYQAVYCLELRFRANRLVSIRDGASSRFERNVIEEFTPIQGLKAFLSKYVDESAVYRGRAPHEDDNPLSPMGMEDNFGGPNSVAGVGAGGSSPFLGAGMRGPQSPRDSGLRFPAPHTPPSSSNPHTPASPHPSAGGGGGGGGAAQGHGNFNLTSPPAPHMPHPSPGGLMPSSPLNPQPSPHMVHSPGPNTLYMPSHQDSPFTAMSPANNNWPGSPSMPRPSPRPGQSPEHKSTGGGTVGGPSGSGGAGTRGSLNRPWAGAVPTLLTHEALETICRPSPHPNKDINVADMSPLERFLGCVYMRRQLHRNIQSEETLTALNSTEPGVVLFKVDGLQCQVMLNQIHMQSLHLKVTQLPPMPDKPTFQLSPDDLLVIEQYFDTRVAAPPYRPNSLHSICRLLNMPAQVLKDFVQIMRLELKPELGGDHLKWTVQMCMRMPPSAVPIVPSGNACVVLGRLKILFFLHITKIPYNGKDWKDSPSLVLPIVYDITTNHTQMAERREQVQSPMMTTASTLLRRFAEYNVSANQCSLFPAITDLLTNLQLNTAELPPPQPNQSIGPPVGVGVGVGGVGVGVGGVGVGVGGVGVGGVGVGGVGVGGVGVGVGGVGVGVVGSSPNPMMPMQQLQPQVGPQVPVGPGGYPQLGSNPGGPQ